MPLCLHFTVTLFSPAIFTVCFGRLSASRPTCLPQTVLPSIFVGPDRCDRIEPCGLTDEQRSAFREDRRHRESGRGMGLRVWGLPRGSQTPGVGATARLGDVHRVGGRVFCGSQGYRGCGRRGSRWHPGSSLFRGAVRRADQYKQTLHMRRRLTIGRH